MTKKHEDYSRTRTFGRTDRRDIPLENDAMFSTVMQYEDACRGLIETIFEGRRVRRLQYKDMPPASQKNIIFDPANKSIRLDVFFEDGDTVYDIEMQKVDTGNLPLRARMYSSMMDANMLDKGLDYNALKFLTNSSSLSSPVPMEETPPFRYLKKASMARLESPTEPFVFTNIVYLPSPKGKSGSSLHRFSKKYVFLFRLKGSKRHMNMT